jgi:hypothetical protein
MNYAMSMSLIVVMFVIPVAYLNLVAVGVLPRDAGLFALVILNSVVWSIHHKLRHQINQETNKRTAPAGGR